MTSFVVSHTFVKFVSIRDAYVESSFFICSPMEVPIIESESHSSTFRSHVCLTSHGAVLVRRSRASISLTISRWQERMGVDGKMCMPGPWMHARLREAKRLGPGGALGCYWLASAGDRVVTRRSYRPLVAAGWKMFSFPI